MQGEGGELAGELWESVEIGFESNVLAALSAKFKIDVDQLEEDGIAGIGLGREECFDFRGRIVLPGFFEVADEAFAVAPLVAGVVDGSEGSFRV